MHKIEFFGRTDVGRVRSNNEDIFMINVDNRFCLVADGMGGAAAGETASQIFAQAAAETFDRETASLEQAMVDCVQNVFLLANDRILKHVDLHPEHKGMGCTAELLAFTATGFVIGHMGDSRTYRLRQGCLEQLTRDHSLVQDQLDQGLITIEQARSHRMRNVILRAVGVRPSPTLDTLRGPVFSRDLFLLCSDGLTDLVQDEEITKILATNGNLPSKADQLVELANYIGGRDNVTVVLAQVA
jgi:PPM family protein phosphatase